MITPNHRELITRSIAEAYLKRPIRFLCSFTCDGELDAWCHSTKDYLGTIDAIYNEITTVFDGILSVKYTVKQNDKKTRYTSIFKITTVDSVDAELAIGLLRIKGILYTKIPSLF